MRYLIFFMIFLIGCSQSAIDEDLFVHKLNTSVQTYEGTLSEEEFLEMNQYNMTEKEYRRFEALNLTDYESRVYVKALNLGLSEDELIVYYTNKSGLSLEDYAKYIEYLKEEDVKRRITEKYDNYEQLDREVGHEKEKIIELYNLTEKDYKKMQDYKFTPDVYLYYKSLVYEDNMSPRKAEKHVVFYKLNKTMESGDLEIFDSLRIEGEHPLELIDYGYVEDSMWGPAFQFRLKRLEYDDYVDFSQADNFMLTEDGSIQAMTEVSSVLKSPYRTYTIQFIQAFGGDTLDDARPLFLLFGDSYVFDLSNNQSFIYEY